MIGFFPATGLGLLLTDAEYSIGDLALLAVVASIGAFMAYKLLVLGLDLRLSPPRSDYWAATLGGSLGAICFFVMVKNDLLVLRTGLLGWAGYGTGFVLGGLVHRRACKGGWRVDSWKWMEHSVGFLGGLGLGISASLFQLGLGNRSWGAPACLVGFLVVFWFVPYLILSDVFQDWAFRLWLVGTARSVSLLGDDAEGGASLPPREGWRTIVSRRCFVVFQIASLASLAPFTLLVERLVVRWEGTSLYRWPFIAAMSVYVSIAIIKSLPIQRDRQKLIVHGTFLAMMTICLALLPFL